MCTLSSDGSRSNVFKNRSIGVETYLIVCNTSSVTWGKDRGPRNVEIPLSSSLLACKKKGLSRSGGNASACG